MRVASCFSAFFVHVGPGDPPINSMCGSAMRKGADLFTV